MLVMYRIPVFLQWSISCAQDVACGEPHMYSHSHTMSDMPFAT